MAGFMEQERRDALAQDLADAVVAAGGGGTTTDGRFRILPVQLQFWCPPITQDRTLLRAFKPQEALTLSENSTGDPNEHVN